MHCKFLLDLPFRKEKKDQSMINQYQFFFELYVQKALQLPEINTCHSLFSFLEISEVRGGLEENKKYKECFVLKRAGGRYRESAILLRCGVLCRCWERRFLVVNAEGVLYSKGPFSQDIHIREFLLFDHAFHVLFGKKQTGLERGLILMCSSRKLHLHTLDLF